MVRRAALPREKTHARTLKPLTCLYDHPGLYAALREPDPTMFRRVGDLLDAYLEGERRRVLDPACGPGGWLRLFGQEGWELGGNDSSLPMVSAARSNLCSYRAEITHGDMRRLQFAQSRFDLAAEVSGVVSELADDGALVEHLVSVAAQLRSGGLYIVLLPRLAGELRIPSCGYHAGPLQLPSGGEARIGYGLLHYDENRETIQVERTVRLTLSDRIVRESTERYALHTSWPRRMPDLVSRVPALELVASIDLPDDPDEHSGVGESIVVFRR
jgi:SAM-dependent methyltransferase